ncbi:MAG: hypothetical protein K0Q79_1967 [Flavipsychrobacter sp.]|jgi:hypothetical protein|nr:hypothetical protein [Flavipsychrobacter sp.]
MKHFNAVKIFLLIALGISGSANGQTWHPYAFDTILSSGLGVNNWYKDYVGQRVACTNPSIVAGNKIYTITNDGSGTAGQWGGAITTPIVDDTVVMGIPDSFGCSAFTNFAQINGNIALIWRGPIVGACEFGFKALQAQNAGARAVVLINEYPGEGPVGMGAGASGTSVTIPVVMIGNLDGIALSAQYNSNPLGTVRMTLTPWGQNYTHDLSFCPGGISIWHNYAIPYMMLGGENPGAYRALGGGFIANFGTSTESSVKLKSTLTWNPSSGTPSTIHSDSMSLASFPATDSIWALYETNEYDLPAIAGPGRYDLTYNITAATADDFPFDNNTTHNFYATDSIFSKGRYDFANGHVITSKYYRAGGNYMWGTPYYVTRGGAAFKDVQFSIAGAIGPLPSGLTQYFYIFKWTDGSFGAGSLDSALQGGELELVGTCLKTFNGTTDSSQDYFTTSIVTADSTGTNYIPVKIDSNSWYYVAADVAPISSTQFTFLGVDGELNMFPRTFGRKHFHNYWELYNPAMDTDKNNMRLYAQNRTFSMLTFGGGASTVDSTVYGSQVGVIPNLAFRIWPYVEDKTSVSTTPKETAKLEVFPNPASEYVTASIENSVIAKTINYTIVDAHARVIVRQIHNNVQNDKFTYSTAGLPSGNYFLLVTIDGKQMYRKFAVIK